MSNFNSSQDPNRDFPTTEPNNGTKFSEEAGAIEPNNTTDILKILEETLESLPSCVEHINPTISENVIKNTSLTDMESQQTYQCLLRTSNSERNALDINNALKDVETNPIETDNGQEGIENINIDETVFGLPLVFSGHITDDSKVEPLGTCQTLENESKKVSVISANIANEYEKSKSSLSLEDNRLTINTSDESANNNLVLENANKAKCIEPTISTLERKILLRGDTCDNKKAKILQLPPETIPNTPSHSEKEIVGDDIGKSAVHILCECEQSGVAGGAVPLVQSFTVPEVNVSSHDQNNSQSMNNISYKKDFVPAKNYCSKLKPSLIPKPANSFRNVRLKEVSSLNQTEKNNSQKLSTGQKTSSESKQTRSISFKRVSLPEKCTASATALTSNLSHGSLKESVPQKELEQDEKDRLKKLTSELSKRISRVAQEASHLSKTKNSYSQIAAVDSLYKQILSLKKMVNDLQILQSSNCSESVVSGQSQSTDENQTETNNKLRNKDNNRIYIKFLPSKSTVKKKKSCSSEVQTDFITDSKSADSEYLEKSTKDEIGPNEVDSMDGIFIPSFDEPPKMDDDDEEGLDITIRFPEFQHNIEENNSHLSVCFSNISAEALGRLKRCPKEFTLRMDFIQGRMFFQSGKSPANNFSIGPDLKITECGIDSKRSDIINIKPSTECLYTSQIIPVEGETSRKNSIKTLKSTDSELFNVVSLPIVNRRNSIATKSCITFKNIRRSSGESLLDDRVYYRSMPQIPSLTNILEEPALETVGCEVRAATINTEKRSRNRPLQKKRTNSSLENISYYNNS